MANKFGAMLGEFEPGCINRITKTGFFIRKTKLDELPELFNVLKGDMSLVGPRPEVERYVQIYQEDFKEVLKIRPGLSDFASIKYRDEEDILSKQRDPEQYYCHVILPDKLQLAKYYVEKMSLKKDLAIIGRTLMRVVGGSLEK